MNAEDMLTSEDFKKCVDFHGHICPGLALGYKASKAGLEWLEECRAEDEEVVAVVETDACCADALQVLTGCTFGKGNFIYKDHGKVAFTFFSRNTGKGVRLSLRPDVFQPSDRHLALINKIRDDEATAEERDEFRRLHLQRSLNVLETPSEHLFFLKKVAVPSPPKAVIEQSQICDNCGEPTMKSKLTESNGKLVCKDCLTQE